MSVSFRPPVRAFVAAMRVYPGKTIKWWHFRLSGPTRPMSYLKFRDWVFELIRSGWVASLRYHVGTGAPHHLYDPADPALPGRPCQPDVLEL